MLLALHGSVGGGSVTGESESSPGHFRRGWVGQGVLRWKPWSAYPKPSNPARMILLITHKQLCLITRTQEADEAWQKIWQIKTESKPRDTGGNLHMVLSQVPAGLKPGALIKHRSVLRTDPGLQRALCA